MPQQDTLKTLIDRACARLRRARLHYGHGVPGPWDEAAYFALHVLKLAPEALPSAFDRPVSAATARKVTALVEQRIRRRVPAAYLTREAWLGHHRFYVDERVIVPRSYIAGLLDDRMAPWLPPRRRIARILDLCTGSGCLAILGALAFPRARVDAIDIDRGALAVARRNVAAYRLQQRLRVLRSDFFAAVRNRRYDLIVANPPYVDTATLRRLPREYRHEPAIALGSGKDGLDAVRVILREAAQHLTRNGLLVVEVGHHRARVEAAFPRHAFIWPETSGGDDCVFILDRAELVRAAQAFPPPRQAAGSRRASP